MKSMQNINQKGFAPLVLIVFALIIVAVIIAAAYFIFNNGNKTEDQASENQEASTVVTDEQLPYQICPTGDPEYCEDTVPESATDNITIEDPDGP